MEANKRNWKSVDNGSKKSQVRQTDQVWYHDVMDESSLARAIHASTSPLLENRSSGRNPCQASVGGVKHAVVVVERQERGKPLEPGCDTHTHKKLVF